MRLSQHALYAFGLVGPLALGCSSTNDTDPVDSSSRPMLGGLPLPIPGVTNPLHCLLARPKDVLIAELVKDSWRVNYPLTRVYVARS